MITEKEAIDILASPDEIYQGTDGIVGYTYNPRRKNYEAFQLAIKALEQETHVTMRDLSDEEIKHFAEEMKKVRLQTMAQEPCEDTISREELKKWLDMNFSFGGALRKIELFNRLDKELPLVTPTRENTTWETKLHGFPPEPYKVCAKCGFSRELNIRIRGYDKIKYCPNCGRKFAEIPTGSEMESEDV